MLLVGLQHIVAIDVDAVVVPAGLGQEDVDAFVGRHGVFQARAGLGRDGIGQGDHAQGVVGRVGGGAHFLDVGEGGGAQRHALRILDVHGAGVGRGEAQRRIQRDGEGSARIGRRHEITFLVQQHVLERDHVLAVSRIGPVAAAVHRVFAATADDDVIAGAGADDVVALAADQLVVAVKGGGFAVGADVFKGVRGIGVRGHDQRIDAVQDAALVQRGRQDFLAVHGGRLVNGTSGLIDVDRRRGGMAVVRILGRPDEQHVLGVQVAVASIELVQVDGVAGGVGNRPGAAGGTVGVGDAHHRGVHEHQRVATRALGQHQDTVVATGLASGVNALSDDIACGGVVVQLQGRVDLSGETLCEIKRAFARFHRACEHGAVDAHGHLVIDTQVLELNAPLLVVRQSGAGAVHGVEADDQLIGVEARQVGVLGVHSCVVAAIQVGLEDQAVVLDLRNRMGYELRLVGDCQIGEGGGEAVALGSRIGNIAADGICDFQRAVGDAAVHAVPDRMQIRIHQVQLGIKRVRQLLEVAHRSQVGDLDQGARIWLAFGDAHADREVIQRDRRLVAGVGRLQLDIQFGLVGHYGSRTEILGIEIVATGIFVPQIVGTRRAGRVVDRVLLPPDDVGVVAGGEDEVVVAGAA